MERFPERFKKLRKQYGYTQEEIAEMLDVHFTYISKIENGKLPFTPSRELINKLEQIFETEPGELMRLACKFDVKYLQTLMDSRPLINDLIYQIDGNLTDDQLRRMIEIAREEVPDKKHMKR